MVRVPLREPRTKQQHHHVERYPWRRHPQPAPRLAARHLVPLGGGSVTLEVATTGFGRLFKHLLGGTPVITGAGPYTHTYPLGDLTGKSLCMQKVLRDTASTEIEAFNFHGCKPALR